MNWPISIIMLYTMKVTEFKYFSIETVTCRYAVNKLNLKTLLKRWKI
jgi:hypothetical protein